jgi:hypothetical protein
MLKVSALAQRVVIDADDARVIATGSDSAIEWLWRHKRNSCRHEGKGLQRDLIAEIALATKGVNRACYQRRTGRPVSLSRKPLRHSAITWMIASVDGLVESLGAPFVAAFLPTSHISQDMLAERFVAPLQHTMWVSQQRSMVLSIITGDGRWGEALVTVDPLYLTMLVSAEKKFWRSIQTGERPHLSPIPSPRQAFDWFRWRDERIPHVDCSEASE